MHCPEALERLQQYLDGEPLTSADVLKQHLVECADCCERFAATGKLRAGLSRLTAPDLPVHLAKSIVTSIQQDRRRRARRLWVLGLSGAAAALLLVVMGRGYHTSSDGASPRFWDSAVGWFSPGPKAVVITDVTRGIELDPEPEVAPAPPSLRESMADAGSAVASLTRRTADETVGQSRILLPEKVPMPAQPGPEAIGSDLEPAAQSLREAHAGANAGLEPVTNSARRAVSLFLRGLPASEPGTEE